MNWCLTQKCMFEIKAKRTKVFKKNPFHIGVFFNCMTCITFNCIFYCTCPLNYPVFNILQKNKPKSWSLRRVLILKVQGVP